MALADSKKLLGDLSFLTECFREVIGELESQELAEIIPWQSDQDTTISEEQIERMGPHKISQLLSLSFHLLNMAEENTNIQFRREAQREGRHEAGQWAQALENLKSKGAKPSEILETIRHMWVEPVLTAHPTEAKRATVLEHHRELYLMLVKRENQMWTPDEQEWLRDDVKAVLERLWRTGEIHLERPDVAFEQKSMMHYFKNAFPEMIPWLDRRFESAWKHAGFGEELDFLQGDLPTVHFGTWVGGDRDGHPFVTADVTEKSLRDLRLNALIVLRHSLVDLAAKLSLADSTQGVPESLESCLMAYKAKLPNLYQGATDRNPGESWRSLVSIMIERLPIEVIRNHATKLDDGNDRYQSPEELLLDLRALHKALREVGAVRLINNEFKNAVRTIQTFGFHTARLDIRQNSQFHDEALGQLLEASHQMSAREYLALDSHKKSEVVKAELEVLRPLTVNHRDLEGPSKAVIECYRAIAQHGEKYTFEGLGSLIVSMTHCSADLFTVYLLAREVGLAYVEKGTLICPLQVVPLFETIEDLRKSADILEDFLSHPVTKASLSYQARKTGVTKPIQQVMVGYSDSCKDGGILASQWNLNLAQRKMSEVADAHGVRICFFHGRGGTISRGAGPINRFFHSLPKGALNGAFRMTEQGETIARKYANMATGVYNLELLMSCLVNESLGMIESDPNDFLTGVMESISKHSFEAYRRLVTHDDFPTFFSQATPIDVLGHANIGSRPAKRTGKATIDDLRAIPWVFSWNQSRFYLPSWYGVGSALENLEQENPESFKKLVGHVEEYPILNYVLNNIETTIASASPEIMDQYLGLVSDEGIRTYFGELILIEHEKTTRYLDKLFAGSMGSRRPHTSRTISMRESSLGLLHKLQVSYLRQWRALEDEPSEERQAVLDNLLLTVNAIASGLRNTG